MHSNRGLAKRKAEGEPDFVEGPGPFFDMYLDVVAKEVHGWKADTERAFVFSGLFSAVIAASLTISIRDLRPNPQDRRTFYLENISQLLANPNRTDAPTSPTQSNPPTFSPPRSAVWVNSLWSLSLVMALSCTLLAILLRQWTRRYTKVTQPQPTSPRKGVKKLHLRWAVDALPMLLHAPLVLYLAGLVLFSFGSRHTVFKVVVSWVGLCAVIYAYFTILPVFRHKSPYYTPLSHPLWLLYTGTLFLGFQIIRWFAALNCFRKKTRVDSGRLKDHFGRRFSYRIEEGTGEPVQKLPSVIDKGALLWTLQSSDEGHELERLLESTPDDRKVLDEFRAAFKTPNGEKMADALIGLMNRTFSSDLIPHSIKHRRIKIYNTMAEGSLPINRRTLDRVLYNDWDGLLDSVEFGFLLRNARYSDNDPFAKYYSQCVVSAIIARVKERDDRWFELAAGQLGISRPTLENYLANGDSMLLANCIFICRRTLVAYSENDWNSDIYSQSKTLELVSKFDIQETLPALQNEFCDVWNKFVRNTKDRRSQNLSIYVLKHIRKIYRELHPDNTDPAICATDDDDIVLLFLSSYPSCQIRAHRLPPAPSSP